MQQSSSTGADSLAILVSPRAGRLGANTRQSAAVALACAGKGRLFTPATEPELSRACAEIRASGCSRLVVVGGDGSFMRVLSELTCQMGELPLPEVSLVPAGTVNLAARQWGIRGRTMALLERALEPRRAKCETRDTLHVTLDGRPYVAFTFGTGLVSRFFEHYEAQTARGHWVAAGILARTVASSLAGSAFARRILSPVRAGLCVDERDYGTLELTLLVTSVFRELGLGLRPTYRAASSPGQLHLVASTLSPKQLGPKVWRVWQGRPLLPDGSAPQVIDCMTRCFRLAFASPHAVVLDGDAVFATRVEVRAGPKLRVLVP